MAQFQNHKHVTSASNNKVTKFYLIVIVIQRRLAGRIWGHLRSDCPAQTDEALEVSMHSVEPDMHEGVLRI
jgi:hypothetical protein